LLKLCASKTCRSVRADRAARSRRAIARWSDGSESEALCWYADEMLICGGDLIGRTREQLRSLQFRRDRDWLQS
jgi:hypothetical protein